MRLPPRHGRIFLIWYRLALPLILAELGSAKECLTSPWRGNVHVSEGFSRHNLPLNSYYAYL